MKAIQLKILVAVVCLALLGLIGIQIYWIVNAFQTERDKIIHSAGEALNEVAGLIERHETLVKLRSHQEAKYLFFQDDTSTEAALALPPDDSLIEYVVNRKVERVGDRIEMHTVEDQDGSRSEHIITHSVSDLPFASTMEEATKIRLTPKDSHPGEPNVTEPIETDMAKLRERVNTKKAFLGDIVKSLIEVNINEPIQERIDTNVLDSLLSSQLKCHGVMTPFRFGVFDSEQHLMLGSEEFSAALVESPLSTRLFPNDVVQLPYYLNLVFPDLEKYLFESIFTLLLISFIFVMAIIGTFYFIVRTVIEQKKSSDIKNDFINNMTHELKTPISTISLACEALSDPELMRVEDFKTKYIGIIKDENKRLGLLVEEVLQSAVLDKGDFKLKHEPIELHQMLNEVIDKFNIQVREREGVITSDFKAESDLIEGDKTHLSNVMYNLLDNALKYSPGQPQIELFTQTKNGNLIIGVRDQGIGISSENLKKVFERLYRVPTGNVHNVKGFGLGLSYVKIIVERHGGSVYAESQMGKGSTFFVEFPLKQEQHARKQAA